MNADCFFTTGKTHSVCEDYARTGLAADGTPYAILADGCSTAPDSDIGARLLVRAAEFDLKRNFPLRPDVVIARAWTYASALSIDVRCLDATLLACWIENGQPHARMYGDGYVAGRRRADGALVIWRSDFPSGAPRYLNYRMDRKRQGKYAAEFGWAHDLHLWSPTHGRWLPCGGDHTDPDSLQGGNGQFPFAEFDMIALFSDGAGTFQKIEGPGEPVSIPAEEVIRQVFDIRPATGEFMVRSGKWFTGVWCRKNNAHHNDDFSVAAINLGPLPEPEPEAA